MKYTNCNCEVCLGKVNSFGIAIAESEVIPFLKKEVLKLQYPKHPFPKHIPIVNSVFAYSQVLAYTRLHGGDHKFYTENEYFLKYSQELYMKFGIETITAQKIPDNHNLVCELNTKELKETNHE